MFPLFVWNLLTGALLYAMLLVSSSLLSSYSTPFLAHWLDPHSHATKIVSLLFSASISKNNKREPKAGILDGPEKISSTITSCKEEKARIFKERESGPRLGSWKTRDPRAGVLTEESDAINTSSKEEKRESSLVGLDPGKQGNQEPGFWNEGSNERCGTATSRRSQQPTERPVLLFWQQIREGHELKSWSEQKQFV